jgi:hypothetical protein
VGVKIPVWWNVVGLVLFVLVFWPVRSCYGEKMMPVMRTVVFHGPGGRSVSVRDAWEKGRLGRNELVFQGMGGMTRRDFVATDSYEDFAVWVAWAEDGKRVFVLSCGSGRPESVDSLEMEGTRLGGVDAVPRLARSMRQWFGQNVSVKTPGDDKQVLTWFCSGVGRAVLWRRAEAGRGTVEVRVE